MGRILYFNHDNPSPSGGVRTIYLHVRHLVRNGFAAFVVHGDPNFRPVSFSDPIPTLYYRSGLQIEPDDILVVPEDHEVLLALGQVDARKVLFCQNHFYIFMSLKEHRSWRDLGFAHVIASSEPIADFIRLELGWEPVPVIHYSLDPRLFRAAAKKLQVAYMPRRRPVDAALIEALCRDHVAFVSIDGQPEAEVARILAESKIFLSLSHLEGFGLPPLEAMACGCAVVGYHGHGGIEYATADNGMWAAEADPLDCVRKLRELVEMIKRNDPAVGRMVDNAVQTAARYTPWCQEAEVVAFFRGLQAGKEHEAGHS